MSNKKNVPSTSGGRVQQVARTQQAPKSKPVSNAVFSKDCLTAHNKYRAMHGCGPLKLNNNLTSLALNWAQTLAKKNKIQHRDNNKYGENIYFAMGLEPDPEQPVKMWYNEIEMYNFDKAEFSPQVGHFTQLIWKETKEVGIGIAQVENKIYVVANYDPPGNVVGQFKENVPKKI